MRNSSNLSAIAAAALLVLGASGGAALAMDAPSAAGRLEGPVGPMAGTCSAVLIAPERLVTAAHCGGGVNTGKTVVFRPGGSEFDTFAGQHRAEHPLYRLPGQGSRRFRFDLSVIELADPVPMAAARPLAVGPPAQLGETLWIASWQAGATPRARMRPCRVIGGRPGVVTLDCQVAGGESGAPVLRSTPPGFEVVAIVTSKTRQGDRPVAQATDLDGRLTPILERLGRQ